MQKFIGRQFIQAKFSGAMLLQNLMGNWQPQFFFKTQAKNVTAVLTRIIAFMLVEK